MAVRVIVVDDSAIIRGLITRALESDPSIQVISTASNGKIAIDQAVEHKPDVMVLDIEMPEMDGITALPLILEKSPNTKIIIASTLSTRNANISMQALSLGASDYLPKPTARDPDNMKQFYHDLLEKIKGLGGAKAHVPIAASVAPSPAPVIIAPIDRPAKAVKALAIASSTGGPQALMTIFEEIKTQLAHIPIFITQHMPPMFTEILAQNLSRQCGKLCVEGKEGDVVQAGSVYIAPGAFHMTPKRSGSNVLIHVNQDEPENFCRPAADPMLRALSDIYGDQLLILVLTGIGQDGLEGSKYAVARGASVIAQDESTSVVWGMPRAVTEQKLCKAVLPLPSIAPHLLKMC